MIPKPTKEALHARVLLPSKEARMFMNSVEDISKFSHTRLCLGDTTMNAEAIQGVNSSKSFFCSLFDIKLQMNTQIPTRCAS
jgi:hypothetical protein